LSREFISTIFQYDDAMIWSVREATLESSIPDLEGITSRLTSTRWFQVFVFLLSFLVTLQQALSSGYINSVITTIEKRFEIPSSLSGLIASSYEIGNVITVIFVSYLGSRRHIPVWIAIGNCLVIYAKSTCPIIILLYSFSIRGIRLILLLLSSSLVCSLYLFISSLYYYAHYIFRRGNNGTGIDDFYGATFHSGAQLNDNRKSFQFG